MNFHPLLVHFPIAFWTIYSIFELARFRFLSKLNYWFYIKGMLVATGTVASAFTYLSGKAIEQIFLSEVVVLHSRVALLTITIYSIISLHYLVSWIEKDFYSNIKTSDLWLNILGLNKNVFRSWVVILMAFMGLTAVTLTGALGGIIAFGPGVDPITIYVYRLFFGK